MKGMPVLRAARQRGSSSGLGAVTKRTPLCTVLSHPIQTPPRQPGRESRVQSCQGLIPPCGAWPADHATQSYQSFSKQQLPNHRLIRRQAK
eukprot:366212-Chlamydomonas_euryale.AAC.21